MGVSKPREDVGESRFTPAGWTGDCDPLASRDPERNAIKCRVPAEGYDAEVRHLDRCRAMALGRYPRAAAFQRQVNHLPEFVQSGKKIVICFEFLAELRECAHDHRDDNFGSY